MPRLILQIALDTPLRRSFDYLPPPALEGAKGTPDLQPGVRVRVPFGRRWLVGVLIGVANESSVPAGKLKHAVEILDREPIFDPVGFALLCWAADYYHHPIGEVFAAAMPSAVRAGGAADLCIEVWSPTPGGLDEVQAPSDRRAPKQRALLAWLAQRGRASSDEIGAGGFDPSLLRALAARNWATCTQTLPVSAALEARASPVELTADQAAAVAAIVASSGRFETHLLFGVTGSGKTEVYLRAIAEMVRQGGQALVLVPEIALTPQLLERFEHRFGAGIAVLHSGLAGGERQGAWAAARSGHARIVIGTRSAILTPLPALALIIVDEEHDASYKQQEGFRYSARDLAVLRAQRAGIPIVLGSATPSLESLENTSSNRYRLLRLPQRPGLARAPKMTLIDLRMHAVEHGLSQPAMQAIAEHSQAGGQTIVFLNRRGFAPTLFCTACGWVASCTHCDARMTLHRRVGRLRCHHCGAEAAIPEHCGQCRQPLVAMGQGTERIEDALTVLFPTVGVARLDRDSVTARGAMQGVLDRVRTGEARILVGTQMLTKGHDFPDVSLVVVLEADQGLFATDYRASERLAQTITQVAGRAGRATRPGEVLIQTQFPDHPLLNRLIGEGYEAFARDALIERGAASWPPFTRLALLRADGRQLGAVNEFLEQCAGKSRAVAGKDVKVLGPAPALIARRADRFRAHLLIEAQTRPALQRFLSAWLPQIEAMRSKGDLRWSIDVDPLEIE